MIAIGQGWLTTTSKDISEDFIYVGMLGVWDGEGNLLSESMPWPPPDAHITVPSITSFEGGYALGVALGGCTG